MTSKKVCLLNCEKTGKRLPLFKFPSLELDFERRRKWFTIIGIEDTESLPKCVYLCSNHFSIKQFTGNFLLKNAVPDVNVPGIETGNRKSCMEEPQPIPDIDDDYRTIRVDKELYERIMNSLIVPGALATNNPSSERTTNNKSAGESHTPKHYATKNMQTGTDTLFPCAMVEYNFEKRGYCLQCFFCSDKFFIHEWDLFEMHMLYQHDDFRKNFFKVYSKTQKILMGLKEKYSTDDHPLVNDKIMTPSTGSPVVPDPLDISTQDDKGKSKGKANKNTKKANKKTLNYQDEATNFIFKTITFNKSATEGNIATQTESIKSEEQSHSETINNELNYLIDELGIDDLEFIEETQEPLPILANLTTILNPVNPSKQIRTQPTANTPVNKIRQCKVLLKRMNMPELNESHSKSPTNPAKNKQIKFNHIREIDLAKLTEFNQKSQSISTNLTAGNSNGSIRNVAQKSLKHEFRNNEDSAGSLTQLFKNKQADTIALHKASETKDNAESEFDTVEMLVEEEKLKQNESIYLPKEDSVEYVDECPDKTDSYSLIFKPYDPFTNEPNMLLTQHAPENSMKFNRNLKISSNEDAMCCSDVYSSDDDDDDDDDINSVGDFKNDTKLNNEIRFKTTPPHIVFYFIELLRTNTVLWFERTRAIEKYDNAVSNVIMDLSVTHKINMTSLEVRRSVNRIKNWFRRMVKKLSGAKTESRVTLPYSPKYDAYFQKCYEFLPTSENYEKWHTSQGTDTKFRAKHLSVVPIYECEFCNMLFESKHYYVQHMTMKHKKCKQCFLSFADDKTLAEHLNTHQNTKASPNYQCKICNKGFYLKSVLRAHMAVHGTDEHPYVILKEGRRVYPCRLCGEEFLMPYMRKWHELKHEGPQFKCNECDKKYYTKFNLMQHQKFHKNQRDHMCDICGKSYFSRKNLLGHQDVVHYRKNSIVCDICGIDISNPTNLERHKRVAHGDRKDGDFVEYLCKRNGQTFVCRRKKRQGPYPNERRKWRCKLCGETFPKFKSLLIHKREEHSVNKIVPCPLCQKPMGETFIKRHIKQVHKDANLEMLELSTLEQEEQEAGENCLDSNIEINFDFDETSQEFQFIEKNKTRVKSINYDEDTDIVVDDVERQNIE